MSSSYADALAGVVTDVDATIAGLLEHSSGQSEEVANLWDAMRYASLAGGKRLRPFLVLSAADICGGDRRVALRVGALWFALNLSFNVSLQLSSVSSVTIISATSPIC